MDPQQLPKTSKFYSRCKKCDIEKTLGGGYHPFGSLKVKLTIEVDGAYRETFSRALNHCIDNHKNTVTNIQSAILNSWYKC